MKKNIWAIAAGIIIAGAFTIVACSKDNVDKESRSTIQSKVKMPESVIVGYAESDTSEIILSGNKDSLIANIETLVQSRFNRDYVVEDVKVYYLDTVPVLQVTFFDSDKGDTYNTFIKLEKEYIAPKVAPGHGYIGCFNFYFHYEESLEISVTCHASNCGAGECQPVNTLKGLTCTACPSGNCYPEYFIIHRVFVEIIFEAFCMIW